MLRVIGFGALTYFLLEYTVDEHFNLYDIIPVAILAGTVINEFFIKKRKNASHRKGSVLKPGKKPSNPAAAAQYETADFHHLVSRHALHTKKTVQFEQDGFDSG